MCFLKAILMFGCCVCILRKVRDSLYRHSVHENHGAGFFQFTGITLVVMEMIMPNAP